MLVSVVTRIGGVWTQRHSELFCMALSCKTFYSCENPHSIVLGKPFQFEEVNAVVPGELGIRFSVDIVSPENPTAKQIMETYLDAM